MRVRRRIRKVPVVLLVMVLTSMFHAGHSVWSFNIPHQVYIVGGVKPIICGNLGGLSVQQRKLCEEEREYMSSIGDGAKKALEECKFQFQFRRWNCSTPKGSFLERITRKSTREAALTYAITSAGVMWALARACAEGNLSDFCGCSREVRPRDLPKQYMWGGCGDNIRHSENFSQIFIDAAEDHMPSSRKHAKTLMNLHNNKIGRMVVKEMSTIECKCHGVSGSCSMKTCWRQLRGFRDVGNALHDKYDAAIHVELSRRQGRMVLSPKTKRRAFKRELPSTKSQLVFLESSPDFCIRDLRQGITGTRGRKCIKDSATTGGCKILCCKKGYNTRIETVSKRCSCKFYWCCKVRCKSCIKNETIHTCK